MAKALPNRFARYKRRSEMLLSKRNMGATKQWQSEMQARREALADCRSLAIDIASQESAIRSKFLT